MAFEAIALSNCNGFMFMHLYTFHMHFYIWLLLYDKRTNVLLKSITVVTIISSSLTLQPLEAFCKCFEVWILFVSHKCNITCFLLNSCLYLL